MPRLIAWVARVCRSWWGWTWPIPAAVAAVWTAWSTRVPGIGRPRSVNSSGLFCQSGPVGEPVVDHGLELRVQRDVAVVVEFADRDPQPVGGADLDDGVGGEAEEFAFAHAGAGQDLDREPAERVGQLPGGGHELRGGGVVEEPGQRFVLDGPVGGEDRWPGRCVGVVPLDDPAEERAEVTHPHPDGGLARSGCSSGSRRGRPARSCRPRCGSGRCRRRW